MPVHHYEEQGIPRCRYHYEGARHHPLAASPPTILTAIFGIGCPQAPHPTTPGRKRWPSPSPSVGVRLVRVFCAALGDYATAWGKPP